MSNKKTLGEASKELNQAFAEFKKQFLIALTESKIFMKILKIFQFILLTLWMPVAFLFCKKCDHCDAELIVKKQGENFFFCKNCGGRTCDK